MTAAKDFSKHPCFSRKAAGTWGRVHLPVAPECNIRCNFCNRKYDCVNESRPGVTSTVLAPKEALRYVRRVLALEPHISVAGIAGPGDPLANPETLETLRLLKAEFPSLIFCLSTNGLALPSHADALADLDVSHVTVTINAVDPEVGARIYAWVRDGGTLLRGREAAALLLERQLEGIRRLKKRGVTVKANTVAIPGVNAAHLPSVARTLADLGVDVQNIMPLFPVAGTPFAAVPAPSPELIHDLRRKAGALLPQMTHCRRCRADAVGLLCRDRSLEFSGLMAACAAGRAPEFPPAGPPLRELERQNAG